MTSTAGTSKDLSNNGLEDNDSIKDFENIPGPKPSLPFIGTGWQYLPFIGRYDLTRLNEANEHKYHTYGPIVREEYQWGKPIINIFDPKDFETVFRNQGKCPMRPPNEFECLYRNSNKDKYPNVGLANMLGEHWYKHRQLLAPSILSMKSVLNYIPTQNTICDDFLEYLWQTRDESTDTVLDIGDATNRLALESISMMCLHSRVQCFSADNGEASDGQQLIYATKQLFECFNELYFGSPLWKWISTPAYRQLDLAESCLHKIVSKHVQKAMNSVIDENHCEFNSSEDFESVLQALLKVEGLTAADINLAIIDFIAGAIFTLSNTLTVLFYHLAANPAVQQKLFDEVSEVIGESETITAEMLANMPYLKACVKECFRLSGPIPGLMRVTPHPIVLSGYRIPGNTIIFSQFFVTSHLSDYFEDPHSYLPERWLPGNRKQGNPFALLPFGYGTRMCIGRRFAELVLHLMTAKLIHKYEISPLQPKLELKFCFIIIPKHQISLKLSARNK